MRVNAVLMLFFICLALALPAAAQDDTLLILLNAHDQAVPFSLPRVPALRGGPKVTAKSARWTTLIDTALPGGIPDSTELSDPGEEYQLQGRSLVLMRIMVIVVVFSNFLADVLYVIFKPRMGSH